MKVGQQSLDSRFNQIPCPVLRTLVKEELITVGPDGQVDLGELQKALKGIGANQLVSTILVRGGHDASPVKPELLLNADRKELDIYRLRGSSLDHTGDTQILRNTDRTYSEEQLQAILALSKDGKTLTLEDLALANKLSVDAEPGTLRDTVIGMAELSALLLVFGTRNDDGVKALKKEDVVSLYRDNRLPEGFEAGKVGLLDVVGALAKMSFQRMFTIGGRANAALELATDKPRMLNETGIDGIRLAVCPAGMKSSSPPVSQAEVAKLHQLQS